MSASLPQLVVARHAGVTEAGLDCLLRTSGAEGPRSSMKLNKHNSLNVFETANHGHLRRYSTSSTKNSMSSITQSTSVTSSITLGYREPFPAQSGLHDRMMQKRSLTSASATRSTTTTPTNHTTNRTVMTRKAGSLTMISVRMAALFSDSSTLPTRNRSTIPNGCGTSMIRILNDRW